MFYVRKDFGVFMNVLMVASADSCEYSTDCNKLDIRPISFASSARENAFVILALFRRSDKDRP